MTGRADTHGRVDMALSLCKGAVMSGLCERCKVDAAVPDGDLCRSCLQDEPAIAQTARVIQLTARCMFGKSWCNPYNPCGECVEHAFYGSSAA